MPNDVPSGIEAPGLEVRADLLRIRLRRDREAVPVAPQGVLEPLFTGRVPHRLRPFSLPLGRSITSRAGTAVLGPGQVTSGGHDLASAVIRRLLQAAFSRSRRCHRFRSTDRLFVENKPFSFLIRSARRSRSPS